MDAIPQGLAGAVTLAALVGLGIFVYPWLLKQRGGGAWVAGITAVLALLFYAFDAGTGTSATLSAVLALLWALAPVAVGVIVWRLGRRRG
ncbi:MAG: hypothetical protein ACK56N_03905 [Betaproteobacteria bacterium]|jgi:hypothetical protein